MVKLVCAIIGWEGSAFNVYIDASETVENLKTVIKAKKENNLKAIDPDKLELFLAKRGDAWMAEIEVKNMSDTNGLEHLSDAQAKLECMGLSDEQMGKMDEDEEAAGNGRVNVVVVIPDGADGSLTQSVERSANKHRDADVAITTKEDRRTDFRCQRYCAQILDKIDTLYCENDWPLPFICVLGSSGMGKTQLAFALDGRRPYFYWLATRIIWESPAIYKNFESISAAFQRFVDMDNVLGELEKDILSFVSDFYQKHQLWTYGFICALLEYCSSDEQQNARRMIRFDDRTELKVKPCDLKSVCAVVDKMKIEHKLLPFFVLDEVVVSSGIYQNTAAFQRNVFRVCGLVVVTLGNDPMITDLFTPLEDRNMEPLKWVWLVPRFPSYQLALDNDREQRCWSDAVNQYPVLRDIATHSRALFARHFIENVVECVIGNDRMSLCDLLDEACAAVCSRALDGINFMNSRHGRLAQRIAISFNSGAGNQDGESPRKKPLCKVGEFAMEHHYANLVDKEPIDITYSNDALRYDISSRIWKPKCYFPAIDEDILLYLAIMGGKQFSSYYDHKCMREKFSAKYIFENTTMFSIHRNTRALKLDYITPKKLLVHAIFSSSRRNGVEGISFNDFFASLLGEFQDDWKQMTMYDRHDGKTIVASDLLNDYSADVQHLSSRKIPFLAPSNAEWPAWIVDQKSGGCKFGHLVVPSHEERHGIYVRDAGNQNETPIFICECEYRERKMGFAVLNNIIKGLNLLWNWKVVFVFCRKLASFRKPWRYPRIGCVKINFLDGGVEWIFQPERRHRKHLLIICEAIANEDYL